MILVYLNENIAFLSKIINLITFAVKKYHTKRFLTNIYININIEITYKKFFLVVSKNFKKNFN